MNLELTAEAARALREALEQLEALEKKSRGERNECLGVRSEDGPLSEVRRRLDWLTAADEE